MKLHRFIEGNRQIKEAARLLVKMRDQEQNLFTEAQSAVSFHAIVKITDLASYQTCLNLTALMRSGFTIKIHNSRSE